MRISRRRGMILLARVVGAGAVAPLLAAAAAAPAPPPPTSQPSPGLEPPAPTTAPAAALPAGLPARLRDALASSARAIDPITLRWTNRAQSTDEIGALARSLNEFARQHDRAHNEHRHYRLTFQGGKYRASHQEEPRERLEVPPLHESAFDGEFMYGGTVAPPHDGVVQTSYLKYPLATQQQRENDDSRYVSADVFDVMGVRLPVRVKEMKSKSPVRSEILFVLEQGGGQLLGVDDIEIGGRKLVRLRLRADDPDRGVIAGTPAMRLYVFHLDPALNFAVRRREEFWEPDIPLSRADLGGHEKLADDRDVFIPRTIVTQDYNRKPVPAGQVPSPVQTRTTEVTQVSGDARPDSTFALAYDAPGTRVHINDEKGRQTGYIVQEDGTLLDARRRPRTGSRTTTTTR